MKPQYFIRWLNVHDFDVPREAAFEVQILDDQGRAEMTAYFAKDARIVGLLHVLRGRLPAENHGIPQAVINAAYDLPSHFGEYVNASGNIGNPGFIPPTG